MKKQLLMIGGSAMIMATAAFARVGPAEGAAQNKEDAGAVARREREEQRRSILAIQNELRQQRESRSSRIDNIRIDAKQVYLRSVLGITEALVADTNRFAICEGLGGFVQTIQLDKSFGGFSEVIIHLDDGLNRLRRLRGNCTPDCKPRRLSSIALRRWLPDTAKDKDFLSEWQSSCEFVASILGVGAPKVKLADIKEWRKDLANGGHGLLDFRRSSRVTFNVANDQNIEVRLVEPTYAMREGKFAVVQPGLIVISINLRDPIQNKKGEDAGRKAEPSVKNEIDFGPDCADKLAKAIRDKKQMNSGR